MRDPIVIVNPSDRAFTRQRFILAFGAYGSTRLMVWANSLEDALDESIDWLVEHAPGHICDDQVIEEYNLGKVEGLTDEQAYERAEVDTTVGGNQGHHILSYEWFIIATNPTRAEVKSLQEEHV